MKTVLISVGPIPGQLDSVKFITNRFKGGLMFRLASELSRNNDVTIIKWKHTVMPRYEINAKIINVDDVYDYFNKVTEKEYDAFILGAAVANLIPQTPFEGKFPSHNYKVGDVIPINFIIAPRAIDEIKKKYPRSLLIGYKLFDGTEEELIQAGWHTLTDSKANAVFCNHPSWAKDKKITLLPDGTIIEMTFDEHCQFINRMIHLDWYRTVLINTATEIPAVLLMSLQTKLDNVIKLARKTIIKHDYDFGTVAMRYEKGFITTTRGKRMGINGRFTYVEHVDHEKKIIYSNEKATLNAPQLDLLFKAHPNNDLIVHGHFDTYAEEFPYKFPGTTEENITELAFNIKGHGCYFLL